MSKLKIISLSESGSMRTLRVRIGEREFCVGFQRIELPGLEHQWLVSREDLDSIFGKALKPHHAPLLAELTDKKYSANGLELDLELLDRLVANGLSFKEAIQNGAQ